jgi:carboxymethylenebutenolidase
MMKSIYLTLLALCLLGSCTNSEDRSSSDKFKDMSREDSFKKAHDAPLPTSDSTLTGENLQLNIAGAAPAKAFFVRKEDSKNYLLVFHEWWGLNTYVKMEAEKYYRELKDVNVIAVDLYDGKVATTPDEASKLTQETKEERIKQIIERVIAYCGSDAKIATMGWCYGGGWSLQTAIMGGSKISGCAMYYGMPEDNVNELKKLKAPVLGVFGNKDDHITPELVNQFEQNMKKLDKKVDIRRYDAVHAFANPSNPNHDKTASEDAFRHTVSFLRFIYDSTVSS